MLRKPSTSAFHFLQFLQRLSPRTGEGAFKLLGITRLFCWIPICPAYQLPAVYSLGCLYLHIQFDLDNHSVVVFEIIYNFPSWLEDQTALVCPVSNQIWRAFPVLDCSPTLSLMSTQSSLYIPATRNLYSLKTQCLPCTTGHVTYPNPNTEETSPIAQKEIGGQILYH